MQQIISYVRRISSMRLLRPIPDVHHVRFEVLECPPVPSRAPKLYGKS
jgi:hypothetical protein